MRANLKIILMLAGAAICGHAQWVNYPTPGIPRTPDGKPNLSAPAPRAANGAHDLSGLWQVEPTPLAELTRLFGDFSAFSVPGDDISQFSKYGLSVLADFKPEEAPLRPEALAILRQRAEKDNPTTKCLPAGLPFLYLLPLPFKVVQTAGLTLIVSEAGNPRQIYTDGRKPPADPQPLWQGYSTGKWEGDTLVVDTVGFNDKAWLDAIGHPHSEALHMVERFRRRDFGHLDVEVTMDDSKMYTKPFTIKFTERLVPDSDVLEYVCEENEKDIQHLK
jgi:hypothetical protein